MAKIDYSRVSSKSQNLNRQIQALEGVSKLFSDKLSGENIERPQLLAMLEYLREGDIVVVTELDRLGRNSKDLTNIMNQIQERGATLEVLNLPSMNGIEDENLRKLINTLIIELYKYQAESERKRIKERQAQGIEIAKQQGRYKGRKRKYSIDDEGLQHAIELYQQGHTEQSIERKTGINRTTFRRYRNQYQINRKL